MPSLGTWCVPCCLVHAARLSLVIVLVGVGARILLFDAAPVSCACVRVSRRLDLSRVSVRRRWVPPVWFVAVGPGAALLRLLARVVCACVRGSLPSLCSALDGGFINHLQL